MVVNLYRKIEIFDFDFGVCQNCGIFFFFLKDYAIRGIGGMIGSVHSLLLPWQANFDTLSIASTSHDEDASSCTSNSSVLSHDDCRSLPRHGYVFKRALGSECHGKRISWLAGHGYRFQSLAHCLRLL